ncbi:MAG: phenylalanine--tRNA ligase beta subunit-related protein [Anaerolineae bacterium]
MEWILNISEAWRKAYPGAAVGVLALRGVSNPAGHEGLAARKGELERKLRERFGADGRPAIKADPIIQAYTRYYKRFKKTYHVLLQMESVALKGQPIPDVAALVEAMFMAELQDGLLTAVHDLDKLAPPIRLDVAQGDESYTRINSQEQRLKRGDMYIADAEGILSSIIYGPDERTRITPETGEALFTTYAPPGIGETAVRRHMQAILDFVKIFSPTVRVDWMEVYHATGEPGAATH